ncbi:MAG: hypothetical protein IKP84_04105 [Prevotella sp.]|nr:hypothetical protein [Prevotella sp.]
MDEKTYQEIIKAQVNESKEVNQLTMIGFTLLSLITIKATGELTVNIWMFYAFISWGVSMFFHYIHSLINRDSDYLIKKNECSNEIDNLRNKNIKGLKSEFTYQFITLIVGFYLYVIGLHDYLPHIKIIKTGGALELIISFIISVIVIATINYKMIRSQINLGILKEKHCGMGFAIAAVITALKACEHCKEISSMGGLVFLFGIPIAFALAALYMFLHITTHQTKKESN